MLQLLAAVNAGHVPSYGHDEHSLRAAALVAETLGARDAALAFVLTGTGANVLALRTLLAPWEAVVCACSAHINTDEGGAPESLAGAKLAALAAWPPTRTWSRPCSPSATASR